MMRQLANIIPLLLLSACSNVNDVNDDPRANNSSAIHIGLLTPYTGPSASRGALTYNSVLLAASEINAAGGVNGQSIDIIVKDIHQSWPDHIVTMMRALDDLKTRGVVAVIGPNASADVLQLSEQLKTVQLAMISPSATSSKLSTLDDDGLVFRVAPSDNFQGRILADEIYASGLRKLSYIYRDDAYGQGLSAKLRERFEENGGVILASVAYPDTQVSGFDADVQTLLANGTPDALVMIGFGFETSAITIALSSAHIEPMPQLFGTDGIRDTIFIKNASTIAIGMHGTAPVSPLTSPQYQHYRNQYISAVGDEPRTFGDSAYDAVYLIALAMQKGHMSNARAVAEHLVDVSRPDSATPISIEPGEWAKALTHIDEDIDYTGASGKIDFDDHGDITSATYSWWQVVQQDNALGFVDEKIITVP